MSHAGRRAGLSVLTCQMGVIAVPKQGTVGHRGSQQRAWLLLRSSGEQFYQP